MAESSRRKFFGQAAAGAALVYSKLAEGAAAPAGGQASGRYDLLVRGGHVIDPASGLSAARDIAVKGSRVARVAAAGIPAVEARQVVDARGLIVTPGLIDLHVHVYEGVAPLGIPADPNCIAKGVTTVVDAGSAGAHTFEGLRKHVIEVARTRVYALLNISSVGQSTWSQENPFGELLELRHANPRLAIRVIESNRDVILGVKIRLSADIVGERDLSALRLAREAADAVKLPLMAHIGGTFSPLPEILSLMRKGDVITHTYRAGANGILDGKLRVLSAVRDAARRGVHFDVGHGAGSFSWRIAEAAVAQDLWPGTISSDVHRYNVNGPVYDLATTVSKFLHLGMKLEDAIGRTTSNAAHLFGFPKGLGTLAEGAEADIAMFRVAEGDFTFTDSVGEQRTGHRKFIPVATIKSGAPYQRQV
jgi:dihydroorotase